MRAMNLDVATSMADGWWYPVGIAVVALASSAHMYRSVKKVLARPDGGVHPLGFREVSGVALPLLAAVPLLHAPGLYGWMLGTPITLGGVGTAVAWGLVIAGAAGMLAATTRRD